KTGLPHFGKEPRIDCIGATVDLPHHSAGKPVAMQFAHELPCPALPHSAEEREVIVLKHEDADVVLLQQETHFPRHLGRFTGAHHLPWRGAIEHVNGAERAGPRATAARQYWRGMATENSVSPERTYRIGQ